MRKEDIKIFIDGIENPAEPNQALKDAAERYSEIYRCPATNDDEYCRHDIISAFNNGAKWQEQQTIEEVFEWLTTNNYLTDLKETLIENFKNK